MVEQEPPLGGFDWDWTRANLGALPTTPDAHDEAVFAPMDQVGTAAEVDITEGGVTIIAGAAEHDVFAVDSAGKEHPIAVEGKKGIF